MESRQDWNDGLSPSDGFDIMGKLYDRYTYPVLNTILGFLDDESLSCCELVSKTWKSAFSDVSTNKQWKVLLQHKITMCPLWKMLHNDMVVNLDDQVLLDYRKHFRKMKYVTESLRKNWNEENCTREFLDIEVIKNRNPGTHEHTTVHIHEKSIVMYNSANKMFRIWDRSSLKLKECFQRQSQLPGNFLNNGGYSLYGNDALIYTTKSGQIVIRNFSTKQTKVHNPFAGLENFEYINYFRTENGYLCVSVKLKDSIYRSDVYIWKLDNLANIELANSLIIPSLAVVNTTKIYMNDRFIVVQVQDNSYEVVFEVYSMTEPPQKKRVFKCPMYTNLLYNVTYLDGFIVTVHSKSNCFKVIDVGTGICRTVTLANTNFPHEKMFLSINLGYVFVSCNAWFKGRSLPANSMIVWSWKFSDVINPNCDAPLPPHLFFKAVVPQPNALKVNPFNVAFLNQGRHQNSITVRVLNFLPTCNFCKEIRRTLSRCGRCKSAKYCNQTCQKADWQHHKQLCQEFQEFYDAMHSIQNPK